MTQLVPPYNPRHSIGLTVAAGIPAGSDLHFPNGFPMAMPNVQFLFRFDCYLSLDPWSGAIIGPESETRTPIDVYAGDQSKGCQSLEAPGGSSGDCILARFPRGLCWATAS